MKFLTPRDKNGNFIISPIKFIYLNLTSAALIGLLFFLLFTYGYNGGNYVKGADLIFFYGKNYSAGELMYVAKHEIGHHIWFEQLSEKDRLEYLNIYLDSNYKPITPYAGTNVEENFAEEFAFYIVCEERDYMVTPDRQKFFNKKINNTYNIVVEEFE